MSQLKLGHPRMTPQEFSTKLADPQLKERAGSQYHFIDVCALVGSPTPADVDKMGMLSRSGGEALRDPLLVCCQLDSAYTLGGSWRKVCAAISHKPRSRRCESL
jgi:hypothetical protein